MNCRAPSPTLSIGWDVGAWNCDKNGKSRDALVILDASLQIVGKPWRGNLRATINTAATTGDWLDSLFVLCKAVRPTGPLHITIGIDTPLGFARAFAELITGNGLIAAVEQSASNPYLFRRTERRLFERGLRPLSAVKDMIGSQATKGMHAIAKFTPRIERCGIWRGTAGDTVIDAIETYPTACRHAPVLKHMLQDTSTLGHSDLDDARVCALVAHLLATDPRTLEPPETNVPDGEGWIWVPCALA